MALHAFAIKHSMQQQQGLNELADAVLLGWTPGDTRVRGASLMQAQEVGVERDQHTLFRQCKRQLLIVRQAAAPGLSI